MSEDFNHAYRQACDDAVQERMDQQAALTVYGLAMAAADPTLAWGDFAIVYQGDGPPQLWVRGQEVA